MMKQPAENTNATVEEVKRAAERSMPLRRDPDHDEIADVARQLWNNRGGSAGSPEADWFEACEIVRKRRAASTAMPSSDGNTTGPNESYQVGTDRSRTNAELHWKEPIHMDNMSNTGTMEHTGVMDRVNDLASRASNMLDDQPKSMPRPEHREGRVARTLEQQTARIPSDAWLWAAFGSIGISLALELSGREKTANFVGHWAPTFLIIGLYNKMVKLQGSDGL